MVSRTTSGFTVEGGVAQKGPFLKGSHVWIDELDPLTFAPAGSTYNLLTNDNQGRFKASAINFTRKQIQTFAEGYYFNEITGTMANDSVLLQAQSDLTSDRLVNVNLLTTLAGPRLVSLFTDKTKTSTYQKFSASRTQAQKEVLAAFRIYNSTDLLPGGVDSTLKIVPGNFNELDLSSTKSANQILAALSAISVKAGVNGVGISQFIANFQLDLADDGLINGTGGAVSVRSLIDSASTTPKIMNSVSSNLNNFYGSQIFTADQLTPWVDSSAGVDRVIDKFKYSDFGIVGQESKSKDYAVGSDDVGQCFSASLGTLYRNGAAVIGSVMAVTSDTFKIGYTGSEAGLASAFIQRSPPLSTGLCPTALPTTSLTRVAKYSVQFSVSIGGAVSGLASGKTLTLLNNGVDTITVTTNGSFTFPAPVAANAAYSVTIGAQPTGQICTLSKSSGNTVKLNINDVLIVCSSSAWTVTTLAGSGTQGGNDGLGVAASFSMPVGMAVDSSGNVFVADNGNHKIRKITPTGTVTTFAGSGTAGAADGAASLAQFKNPSGLAIDAVGNVYVTENSKVRKITPAGVVSTLAGNGTLGNTNGTGANARFHSPTGVAVSKEGIVYIVDRGNNNIRKIEGAGVVTTLAGSGAEGSADGAGVNASFNYPQGITVDSNGAIYVADTRNNKIRRITSAGVVSTFAGTGIQGSVDGISTVSTFNNPYSLTVSVDGNLYVADTSNNKVRKITLEGEVSTIAGSGVRGSDDGLGPVATFKYTEGIAGDSNGILYVADYDNHKIRKVSPSVSGMLYVWYAYSGDSPVPYEAWANDSLTYLHTAANRSSWGNEVKTIDIKAKTQITKTTTGTSISVASNTSLKGMKANIDVTGLVSPWSIVVFNYTCNATTCVVGDAWSETAGVTVNVKLSF